MVVEIAQFKVKPGVSDERLFAVSQEAYEGYLSKCKGFVSRELLKEEDGTWFDVVHFATMEDAQAAAENFPKSPSAKAFEDAIDPTTATMHHFELAKKY